MSSGFQTVIYEIITSTVFIMFSSTTDTKGGLVVSREILRADSGLARLENLGITDAVTEARSKLHLDYS